MNNNIKISSISHKLLCAIAFQVDCPCLLLSSISFKCCKWLTIVTTNKIRAIGAITIMKMAMSPPLQHQQKLAVQLSNKNIERQAKCMVSEPLKQMAILVKRYTSPLTQKAIKYPRQSLQKLLPFISLMLQVLKPILLASTNNPKAMMNAAVFTLFTFVLFKDGRVVSCMVMGSCVSLLEVLQWKFS